MADDHGLTLVEMLTVLAIIGVAAGAAVLSMAPVGRPAVRTEADVLARSITRAADATLAGDPADLVVDPRGYAIDGVRHDLPAGIALAPAASIAIDSGATAGFQLDLAQGGDRWRVSFDGVRARAEARP